MKLLIILLMAACNTLHAADNATDQALQGLAEAAVNTPYLAKVQHVSVVKVPEIDPKTQEEYEAHIYSANVLTSYRGSAATKISYVVRTEKNEEAVLDTTAVIVALCLDESGQLYWPGTGSQFPADQHTEMWLSTHKDILLQPLNDNTWCNE